MEFPQPLARGRLVRRYKRFLADVILDEVGPVTAHVANPGAMLGLVDPGMVCWLSPATTPGRKLPWSLEAVEVASGVRVGVNTLRANALAAEAVAGGHIPELAGYATLRSEVVYGDRHRVDLLLEHPRRPPCWVEVKSATLSRSPGLVEWPDCVSARGARHLGALAGRAAMGERAVLLFVVQRGDAERFALARDLDPAFAAAADTTARAGVEVLAYGCAIEPGGFNVDRALQRGDII